MSRNFISAVSVGVSSMLSRKEAQSEEYKMNESKPPKTTKEILSICSNSEFSKYRVHLNFLRGDKKFYSGYLHELIGIETLVAFSYTEGGGTLKEIRCPHCRVKGFISLGYNFKNQQSKIWCRSCDKTSVYKYSL